MTQAGFKNHHTMRRPLGTRRLRVGRLVAAAAVAVVVLGTATVEAANPVKRGVYKATVKLPQSASRQPTLTLTVSRSGNSFKFVGPHERCDSTFNPVEQTIGRIPKVAVSRSGAFTAKRKYTVTGYGSNHTYHFHWDIKLSGRFVTRERAKGTLSYEMTETDDRSVIPGRVLSCGRHTVSYTARLKK